MGRRGGRAAAEVAADGRFWVGLARAFGGAILFSLPLLMTMEMWQLGFYMGRLQLVVLMVVMIPLLIRLSHYTGFKETSTWRDDVADAAIAYGVGFVASAIVLAMFDVIHLDTPLPSLIGKVALQAVPGSFGAMLATAELGGEDASRRGQRDEPGYGGTLFLMAAGALFLGFSIAPTEEIPLLAFRMTHWHGVALAVASLLLMHAFVYAVDFRGGSARPAGVPSWSLALRYTIPGYAIALLVSAYILWTFGRFVDHATARVTMEAVVLGFPASIGAASARLVL